MYFLHLPTSQQKGLIERSLMETDDRHEIGFKPGLLKLIESLIIKDYNFLPTINDQKELF